MTTILIPSLSDPRVESRAIRIIKKIVKKLELNLDLTVKWIVFKPNFEDSISENEEIKGFENYENAQDVIEKEKPDLIFISGWLEFPNSAFSLAGKDKHVPIVVIFSLEPIFDKYGIKNILKKRINVYLSKKEKNSKDKIEFSDIINQYRFFVSTIKNLNNKPKKYFSLISFLKSIVSKILPTPDLINGDILICFTKKISDYLIKTGYDKDKISICKNPDYEEVINLFNPEFIKKEIDSPKILFCTSSAYESGIWSKEKESNVIIDSLKRLSEKYQVSLKIHPSLSSIEYYGKLLEENNLKNKIFQNENLIDLIQKNDIIITYGNTSVIFYGILLNKPVLLLNFFKDESEPFGYNSNIYEICRNPDEIQYRVQQSLKKSIPKKILLEYIEEYIGSINEGGINEMITKIRNLII